MMADASHHPGGAIVASGPQGMTTNRMTAPGTVQISAPDWRRALAEAFTSLPELLFELGLEHRLLPAPDSVLTAFPLRVPRGFVARMTPGDPNDPLLLQILPRAEETQQIPGFIPDPVGDLASVRVPGLLQKYQGRALVISTGACAVHCRYCFRRNFPYSEHICSPASIDSMASEIEQDLSVTEIILSGGDPLSLGNSRLTRLIQRFDAIRHVRRIRLHTRMPIVLPERIDAALLKLLSNLKSRLTVVIHANHPRELDDSVIRSLAWLRDTGAILLNQSVLLRNVNDDTTVLAQLSETLFDAGVLPYYLHQLDPVAGAAHFSVSDRRAIEISTALTTHLPGYLVPRLVRELPGMNSKTRLEAAVHNANPPHNQNLVT